MTFDGDPYHPIIERPWEYQIRRLCYDIDPDDDFNSYLDMTLARGTTIRRLRFLGPQDLRIERGFCRRTGGTVVLDVRGRQLEGLRVRVANFEGPEGSATLWARDVLDLDIEPPA